MKTQRAAKRTGFCAAMLLAAAAQAEQEAPFSRRWAPANSALTLPAERYETALFGPTRFGVRGDLELGSRPLLFFVLPQVELKYRFWEASLSALAVRGRAAYLTPFLHVVSRSGPLGLLPATTDPPQAIGLEADLLATTFWSSEHTASLWLGLSAAPRTTSDDLPLLDFPFLYPRFAPLYGTLVPRGGIALDGRLVGPLAYGVDLRGYLLPIPDVEGAFAVEQATSIEYKVSSTWALELGLRISHARYPIGLRTHLLPFADLRFGF